MLQGVRVVRVAVGLQHRATADALPALVHACQRAQEGDRSGGEPWAGVGTRLADQHLGRRVGLLDRRVTALVEAPVERRPVLQRPEPRAPVGLVPDAVAVYPALEVR